MDTDDIASCAPNGQLQCNRACQFMSSILVEVEVEVITTPFIQENHLHIEFE